MFHQTATDLLTADPNDVKKFFESFDTVITDCEGVLWKEDEVISGSPEVLNRFRELGKRVFYITSNNMKRSAYSDKAKNMGYIANEDEVLSTAYLTAEYLKEEGFNKKAYLVGSEGLTFELDRVGIQSFGVGPDNLQGEWQQYIKMELDPNVGAVVVGFDPHFSFVKLMRAATYLKNPDCLFVATSTDARFPIGNVVIPGSGSIICAVQTCANRTPFVVGKPHNYLLKAIIDKYQVDPARTLIIGDTCATDILLGARCGFQTLLVLTGVACLEDVHKFKGMTCEHIRKFIPDVYVPRLGDLITLLT